jgi:hypothetical protein
MAMFACTTVVCEIDHRPRQPRAPSTPAGEKPLTDASDALYGDI